MKNLIIIKGKKQNKRKKILSWIKYEKKEIKNLLLISQVDECKVCVQQHKKISSWLQFDMYEKKMNWYENV